MLPIRVGTSPGVGADTRSNACAADGAHLDRASGRSSASVDAFMQVIM
jgi:hypothetical protein